MKVSKRTMDSNTLAQLNQLWKDRQTISRLATAAHDAGKMQEYTRLNCELLRLDSVYERMKDGE